MSQHKRNTTGMICAVKDKRAAAIERVTKVIDELAQDPESVVTFNNVAKLAKVSKAWLYRYPDIKHKLGELRRLRCDSKNSSGCSTAKHDSVIIALKVRVQKLECENSQLRKQLEVVYGKLHSQETCK
jgi:hypothetical protein